MYSVILMCSLTTPADVPQGLLFHRGSRSTGCSGTALAVQGPPPERSVYHAPAPVRGVLTRLGERLHERPRHGLFVANAPRSYGCAGSATISVAAAPRATGCSGGVSYGPQLVGGGTTFTVPAGHGMAGTTVTVGPTTTSPTMEAGGFLERHRVHRQLNKALRQADMTPDQAADVVKVMKNQKAYEKLVDHVHGELQRSMQASGGKVGAIGDGHLLDLIISRMPQILAIVKEILAMFSFAVPHAPAAPGLWLPMPAGPWPLPRVVPPAGRVECVLSHFPRRGLSRARAALSSPLFWNGASASFKGAIQSI